MKIPRLLPFVQVVLACSAVRSYAQEADKALTERARETLQTALTARNPDTRMKAIQAMSLIGAKPDVISTLTSTFEIEKDVPLKLAIVECAAGFRDDATLPLLEKALKDEVPEVVLAAAKALYVMKKEQGKDVLFSILIREEKASSGFLSSQKRDYLRMLNTPKKLMMMAATMAPVPFLGMGLSSAQAILNDPTGSARAAIILMVQDDPDPAIRKTIKASVDDKEWSVRAASIHVLALKNDTSLREDLPNLLDDKNDKVRFRAAAAVLRLDSVK